MDDNAQIAAIARLEATVATMARSLEKLEKRADLQTRQLTEIEHQLSEARGGLRVLMWIGGMSGALVTAVVAWAARHINWQP